MSIMTMGRNARHTVVGASMVERETSVINIIKSITRCFILLVFVVVIFGSHMVEW